MTIRQFFSGLLMKAAGKVNPFLAAEFHPWELSRGRIAHGDFDKMIAAYSSWAYKCASLNANSVAQVPLRLYVRRPAKGKMVKQVNHTEVNSKTYDCYLRNTRLASYITKDTEIEEVLDHPFLELMKNVNPWRNSFDLRYETQLFLELTGNSYWYLRGNGLGVPAEIWVLPANRVTIVPDPVEFIKRFEFRRAGFGEPEKFDPSEMIHFRFPNPKDVLYGMGPLMGAANAIDVNQFMRDYEMALFENQARPDFVVKMKGSLNKEGQRERFKKMWQGVYGGRKKAGKFAVLEEGMDIEQIGFSPKELNFLVGRKVTMQEIVGIFGVPMSKVTSEDVNLANAKIGEYQYMKDTIVPRLKLQEEKLNEKLLPLYDEKLFALYDNPVPEDQEFRLKEKESNLKTGYSSINQERQVDGQEEVPWGEVPLMPMNLMPISSSKAAEEKKEFNELIKDVAEEITNNVINGQATGTKEADEKLRERKWLTFIKRQSPYERKFGTKLRELFSKQEAEVLANMKRSPKSVKANWEDDWLFNEADWIKRFGEAGRPFLGGVMEDVGESTMGDLAVGIDFDIDDPRVQRWLGMRLEQYSKDVNKTTLKGLKATLREGVRLGESIPELRKRVQDVFTIANRTRATMIARTETITASNRGAIEAMIQSGVVEKKQWYCALDERTCDECMDLHEQAVGLEENFSGGVYGPSLHVQCRCTVLPVLSE